MTILKTSYEFYKKFSIPVKIKISIKKILRNLDEENQITIPMSCHLNETLKTDICVLSLLALKDLVFSARA